MQVLLILPTLDEGPLLLQTVQESFALLPTYDVHALIAASASRTTAETRRAIQELQSLYPGRVEAFDQIMPGVGEALKEAFVCARGDVVVIMTPDMETPPSALPQIIQKIEEGFDVVATTRWRKGVIFNGYDPVKLFLNFIFQQLFRALYLTRLSDLTYGYRAFKIEVIKNIRWEESRHPFFFEMILKPLRLGYTIAEVDVPWDTFIARRLSVGRATPRDLLTYVWVGLRNRFMSKEAMRA